MMELIMTNYNGYYTQPLLASIVYAADTYAVYCHALTVKAWHLQIIVHDTSTKDTNRSWPTSHVIAPLNPLRCKRCEKDLDKCLYKEEDFGERKFSLVILETSASNDVPMGDENDYDVSRVRLPSQEALICLEIWRTAQNHVPARRSVFPFSVSCSPVPFPCMP